MTTFFDHGVHGGIIYSAPFALTGAPHWLTVLAFFIGFFDGSRADWYGDYTKNHARTRTTPADYVHIRWVDPIFHKYGNGWWPKIPLWLKIVVTGVFLGDIAYFLYIISLFWR